MCMYGCSNEWPFQMNDENAHWAVIHASRASNVDTDLSTPSTSTTLEYEQYFSYNVKNEYRLKWVIVKKTEFKSILQIGKIDMGGVCAFFLNEEVLNQEKLEFP